MSRCPLVKLHMVYFIPTENVSIHLNFIITVDLTDTAVLMFTANIRNYVPSNYIPLFIQALSILFINLAFAKTRCSANGVKWYSYTLSREYWVVRNRYSQLLFTSEDRICEMGRRKNNQRIWRHCVSSCDVTDQLWWRHNAKTENTVLGDDGKMSDRWFFIAELFVQNIK